jgi:hypothetical protein
MATKYAITGGGTWAGSTWNTASNQSVSNTTKPTASDIAVLDQYSGSVTLSASEAAGTLTMTGYTNNLTIASARTLTLSGNTHTLAGNLLGDGTGVISLAASSTLNGATGIAGYVNLKLLGNATVNTNGMTWGEVNISTGLTLTLTSALQCVILNCPINVVCTITNDVQATMVYIGNKATLTFTAGKTLTASKFYISGVQGIATTLKSGTPSSDMFVSFIGSENDSVIFSATLTDVNFTSVRKMYNWFGTNTRVTKCTVVTPANLSTTNLN